MSELAQQFAPGNLKEIAALAGLWHDAGKYQLAFQRYIRASPEASNEDNPPAVIDIPRSVPHSGAGAALAFDRFGIDDIRALLLALVIEAHHGALKSLRSIEDVVRQRGTPLLQSAREGGLPQKLEIQDPQLNGHVSALAIRMLFSALVDADLLNTEAWDRGEERPAYGDNMEVLRDKLAHACETRMRSVPPSELNLMRRDVYASCVQQAEQQEPGSFTLTVPTGGGKTLSGMAFALHHAVKYQMRRVIVVAPYTSILEQTAQVYRDALGEENVIEHHSNLDLARDTDRNRQACENWDAPVIVTTSVQFFESLYSAHKRPCRKLHRIANSVVILDEVQTFPVGLLQPIHLALKQLTEHFHTTVVHSTATQPLIEGVKNELPKDVQTSTREIVREPAKKFDVVRNRFSLHRLGDLNSPIAPDELAEHARKHASILVIVHSRIEAQDLAERLGPECLHLSAAMCAEHRSAVLREVRRRLQAGEPCRVVATQLIEAGVDIDFPVVFRALAGLETLAQAAGRCNREMKRNNPGLFYVFRPGLVKDSSLRPSLPPKGSPRVAADVALRYFNEGDPDLNDPALFPRYARSVFRQQETDLQKVMEAERDCDFPLADERFRMIDNADIPVVSPYGEAMQHVGRLRKDGPTRDGFRRLQRFIVTLPRWKVEQMYRAGVIEPVLHGEHSRSAELMDVLWTVRDGVPDIYHDRFGFTAETGEHMDPGHLIV